MFATLLGPLPRPPVAATAAPDEVLDAVIGAQLEAGLEPLTDGGWPVGPADPVASWRATAARTDRIVKAVRVGPFSSGLPIGASLDGFRDPIARLADAGCAMVEIVEPQAVTIGTDAGERARFRDLHERFLDGISGIHVSLAIIGGSADAAGAETILAAPYASLAVDLVAGPDNWRLVTATPGERGIVCGALGVGEDADEGPEILLWAAGYAASSRGRGVDRVGLATASSMAALPWDVAVRRMRRLGEASRLVGLSPEAQRAALDPRAIDMRSAATGRYTPPATRRGDRRTES